MQFSLLEPTEKRKEKRYWLENTSLTERGRKDMNNTPDKTRRCPILGVSEIRYDTEKTKA